jgi:hypothetical protein
MDSSLLTARPHAIERRRHARRVPQRGEPVARMRARTGWEATVIDVGDGGALIEGSARLLPGTHVEVHVMTRNGRLLIRSRVVRAAVCHVQSDAVRYRTALAFDRTADTAAPAGYALPGTFADELAARGNAYPVEAPVTPR